MKDIIQFLESNQSFILKKHVSKQIPNENNVLNHRINDFETLIDELNIYFKDELENPAVIDAPKGGFKFKPINYTFNTGGIQGFRWVSKYAVLVFKNSSKFKNTKIRLGVSVNEPNMIIWQVSGINRRNMWTYYNATIGKYRYNLNGKQTILEWIKNTTKAGHRLFKYFKNL